MLAQLADTNGTIFTYCDEQQSVSQHPHHRCLVVLAYFGGKYCTNTGYSGKQ